jgi:hypothetical protein
MLNWTRGNLSRWLSVAEEAQGFEAPRGIDSKSRPGKPRGGNGGADSNGSKDPLAVNGRF